MKAVMIIKVTKTRIHASGSCSFIVAARIIMLKQISKKNS